MKTAYEGRSFTDAGRAVVQTAEQICADYDRQGYQLTLRQLYYRIIAGDLFPESRRDPELGTKNTERNYKWLGGLVSDGRIAGMIDWAHITDRGRIQEQRDTGWDSPEDILRGAAQGYRITHWDGQPEYIEVWVEKDALSDVIGRPCDRWDVTSFACKGYVSQSAMHEAALRFRRQARDGRKCTIIHLGDHDPSGLDMTRDIAGRMRMFLASVAVDRIALNMDQVLALNPPPSPAKVTDSRSGPYIEEFHDPDIDEPGEARCWELDAIEPAALDTLIEEAILGHLDQGIRQARLDREADERRQLTAVTENWPDLLAYMQDSGMVAEPGDEDEDE
jgi:hypothetical protein